MTDEKLTRSLTKVSRMLALFLLLFAIEDAFVLKYGLVRYGGPYSAVYLGLLIQLICAQGNREREAAIAASLSLFCLILNSLIPREPAPRLHSVKERSH